MSSDIDAESLLLLTDEGKLIVDYSSGKGRSRFLLSFLPGSSADGRTIEVGTPGSVNQPHRPFGRIMPVPSPLTSRESTLTTILLAGDGARLGGVSIRFPSEWCLLHPWSRVSCACFEVIDGANLLRGCVADRLMMVGVDGCNYGQALERRGGGEGAMFCLLTNKRRLCIGLGF